MDTFKDKQQLDDMNAKGNKPWEVWKNTHSTFEKEFKLKNITIKI